MTKHRFGDFDKLVEKNELERLVRAVLRDMQKSTSTPVRRLSYQCFDAVTPMLVDDPARLPSMDIRWDLSPAALYLYRYATAASLLVLAWWDFTRGYMFPLDVVFRVSVLRWMLDNDSKLYDLKQEMPCELPKF